jgi:hypothetical protein
MIMHKSSNDLQLRVQWLVIAFCGLLAALCILWPVAPAYAHTRVEIGPYIVVVGWQNEPVIAGERNALVFEISEGEEAVNGVEATLDAQVLYGGRSMTANLAPTSTPGLYRAELFPTVRGQYTVRLFGTLGDTPVDELIEPEEVLPAGQLHFPEALPDTLELQQQLNGLQGQVQGLRTAAFAGTGLGLLGLLVGAIGLLRRRR